MGTVLAWVVVPLALAALVASLIPVHNGRAQDCGTPLAFVASGRVDALLPDVDRPGTPDLPPTGFSEAEYRRAAERPCRERAGSRMALAAGSAAAAVALGLAGALATFVGRSWLGRPPRGPDRSALAPAADVDHRS